MGPPDAAARADLEARLIRRARRFDLKPLVDLLIAKGYPREHILFEGTHEGSAATLVEAIRFTPHGVVITLNLGLLGDNSLLPSYFFQVIDGTSEPERFYDFIRFFDHRLIANLLRALYPEQDQGIYRDWSEVLRSFLRMLGPGSVSTMHWLAQLYFPDLGVRVRRWAFSESSDAHAFKLPDEARNITGSKLDGSGILGRRYESEAPGLAVDLFAEEETNARGLTWPKIVRRRFHEHLRPLLDPFGVPLRVRLTVMVHESWVKVDVPFADQQGYLGYERIVSGANASHTTTIWRGVTGRRRRARPTRVKAMMPVSQINEMFGVKLPLDKGKTIGRLMHGMLGHEPAEGESVHLENLKFTAEHVYDSHGFDVLVEQVEPGESGNA